MPNYISALNGEQMDVALMDVALHNSEAWAVGTRNTIPVSSADETYHNNAKYYAQVAQSAIPGTYTAAVRWDIAQGLAGEAQEQARANISAGASNRNLLDNPFFTIRQMGTGGVTGAGYAVDRWKNTGGANLTQTPRSPYGITFASSGGYQVDQALWKYPAEYLDGETLTISVMTSGGSIAQASGVFTATSSTAAKVAVTSADGNFVVGLYYIPSARAVPFVRITTPSGKFPVNAAILAVKLEKGSYSTLANDLPPAYKTELDKCHYYCRVIEGSSDTAVGQAVAGTQIRFPMPFVMRANPSASTIGAIYASGTGGTLTASSVTASGWSPNSVELSVTVTGATTNTPYRLWCANGAKIILSADL